MSLANKLILETVESYEPIQMKDLVDKVKLALTAMKDKDPKLSVSWDYAGQKSVRCTLPGKILSLKFDDRYLDSSTDKGKVYFTLSDKGRDYLLSLD